MLDQLPAEARTVTGIRLLMKQLCEALDALAEGVSLSAPDTVRALLAIRNEIVPVIDQRLAKSAELIRRGLRDEAVSYAAEPPELVQAATLLDISRHARWKIWLAKLTELNIPAPQMPRMDLVATMTSAQDELVRLKPLLDAWRRMNLGNAPLADRIAMLGKLRKADPENELWFEATQEHQRQRIPGLERDVAVAIKAQDDLRLTALVAEMQQEWIEPVPPRILSAARSALKKLRGGRLDCELDALVESLTAAHDARDLEAARTLRERWQELVEQKGSFAVDDQRLAAVLPAVAWVDANARMAVVSEEIWNALDDRPGGLRMRQEWVRSLERLGNEMEDLAEKLEGDADGEAIERAHERIGRQRSQLERDLRFRRMMAYVGIASVAAILGLGVWYFDDRARYDKAVQAALRDLQSAREQIATGTLLELPDYEKSWPAKIANNPAVSSLIATVRGESDEHTSRRTSLNAALDKARGSLHNAEGAARPDPLGAWPPAFADASRSLTEIDDSKLAVTDQEQADVARVKAALERLSRKMIGEADGLCRQRIAGFDAELDKARNLLANDGAAAVKLLETLKPAITALRGQATAAAATGASANYAGIRVASEPIISLLAPNGSLMRKADAIEGMLASRNKFRQSEKELDHLLGDWKRYTEQLQSISREFAEFPEARDYARAAESQTQWPAVDAWRGFQPVLQQLDRATPEQAKAFIANFEALPQEAKNLPPARQIQKEFIPLLEKLADRDLAKLRTELETWFAGTWLGELKFVIKTVDEDSGEEALYYCLVGHPVDQPNFMFVTGPKDAEIGWPTKKSWRKAKSVAESPQSKLADDLRAQVRESGLGGGLVIDQLFVGLLQAIADAQDVDPVPRLVTARKLVLLAPACSRPWREAGQPLVKLLDDGKGGVPGLAIDQLWSFVPPTREQDATYQLTKQKSENLLRQVKSGLAAVKEAITNERKVLQAPPVASFTLAGRLGRNDAGDLIAIWKGNVPPPGDVWWFPPRADIAVAGNVDGKGAFHPATASGSAGAPLFTKTTGSKQTTGTKKQAAGQEEQ
jgi:hypothetical protein